MKSTKFYLSNRYFNKSEIYGSSFSILFGIVCIIITFLFASCNNSPGNKSTNQQENDSSIRLSQLLGTWLLVSSTEIDATGKESQFYGSSPKGYLTLIIVAFLPYWYLIVQL